MYFLALLLMISNPPPTVITATVGLLTGYLYRSDITGLKTYRVSRRLRAFSRQFLLPLIGSTPPPRRSNIALPNEVSRTSSQRREGEGTPGANANATSQTPTEVPPTAEPGTRRSVVSQWVSELATGAEGVRPTTETEISALMDMFPGLRREEAVSALQRSSDIQAAANVILQRQG
ncbi:hypothetical protein FRC02_004179 [Tulasnella sp. 418]|nr:hypothetical protein FRC02_004179 [Tulasnella sp. 418]